LKNLLLIVVAAAACTANDPSAPPGSTPLPTATLAPASIRPTQTTAPAATSVDPAQELPAAGSALDPGRYVSVGIKPRLTFEVGAGWVAQQRASGFFDVEQEPGSPDVVAVQFANVVPADSAADALATIEAQDHLSVSAPREVAIGALSGVRVVVETTDSPAASPPVFRPVLMIAAGPLSIASGRRLQVDLYDATDRVLAILVGGSIAEWDRTLSTAQPVLDSIRVED